MSGGLSKARLGRPHDALAADVEFGAVPGAVMRPDTAFRIASMIKGPRSTPTSGRSPTRRSTIEKGRIMAAQAAAAAPSAAPELLITRVFDAPRPLVFEAWTRPEHLASWWGPQGFVNVVCEADVRPGGAWFRRMRSPEGTFYIKRGVYREVVPPERLVFTYINEAEDGTVEGETLVAVTFEEEGARTRLTLHHTGFETLASRDGHRFGWTSCLERFAEHLVAA